MKHSNKILSLVAAIAAMNSASTFATNANGGAGPSAPGAVEAKIQELKDAVSTATEKATALTQDLVSDTTHQMKDLDAAKSQELALKAALGSLRLFDYVLKMARHEVNSEDPFSQGSGYVVASVSTIAGARIGIPAMGMMLEYARDVLGAPEFNPNAKGVGRAGLARPSLMAYQKLQAAKTEYRVRKGFLKAMRESAASDVTKSSSIPEFNKAKAAYRSALSERMKSYAFAPTSRNVLSLPNYASNVVYRAVVRSPQLIGAVAFAGVAAFASGPVVGLVLDETSYLKLTTEVADDIAFLEAELAAAK